MIYSRELLQPFISYVVLISATLIYSYDKPFRSTVVMGGFILHIYQANVLDRQASSKKAARFEKDVISAMPPLTDVEVVIVKDRWVVTQNKKMIPSAQTEETLLNIMSKAACIISEWQYREEGVSCSCLLVVSKLHKEVPPVTS